jgi:ribonuclease T2
MKSSFTLLLFLALAAVAGCKSSRTSEHSPEKPAHGGIAARHAGHTDEDATAGDFDLYVFRLSWSPDFCVTHSNSPECAARRGFVVQGLWPQKNDGTYPENCSNPAVASNPSAYLDLIPDLSLLNRVWITHGACSGLGPDAYFTAVETALRSFEIPSTFASTRNPPAKIEPKIILDQLRSDNPSFPAGSFAVACDQNSLTAVEVCFDKSLDPVACKAIQGCGAKVITVNAP